mmetsp:Transcript_16421/g.30965  ORF Transcript_16421/g.30965 Transcript_16421/m.30965 type:complete len:187 (-) Transcript_16421:74-634(-)
MLPPTRAPTMIAGEASDIVSVLEHECLAQDHAGSVRIADAESKGACIRLEQESVLRALPTEREQHLVRLQQRRRDLELEVNRQVQEAQRQAFQEERCLQASCKLLSDTKVARSLLMKQVQNHSDHATFLLDHVGQRVGEVERFASTLADQVRSDGESRRQTAEVFAKVEDDRIAAVAALPVLSSLK